MNEDEIKTNVLKALGGLMVLLGFVLMFIWYDWKLALIIWLFVWGNNIVIKQIK